MLATALVALDATIIAPTVPSIVASLGGLHEFPWLFSIYLLAQAITVPLYGKVADLFGRKPVLLFGIGVFLVGSVMCAVAWDMTVLIAFRAVQGLGAGAIQPISLTLVGDLYSLQERAKVQGYLASVWGISSVVGPALGGVVSEYASWRWIFLVNIPICAGAAVLLVRRLREDVPRRRPRIDLLGALLLTAGLGLLILGILEGGQAWAWSSTTSVAILGAGAALLTAFALVETRAPEPVLPLWILRRRLLVTSSLVSFGVGGVVLGLTAYVPTFAQAVLGVGPLAAGFALATVTIGWPLSASQAGRLYLRLGARACALIGSAFVLAGTLALLALDPASSVLQVAGTCFVVGLGMGLIAPPTLIAAQASVDWHERGVVTGMNLFCRSLGSALGVAVFGAVANGSLGGSLAPARMDAAVHHVFVAVAVLAALMALAVALMPRRAT